MDGNKAINPLNQGLLDRLLETEESSALPKASRGLREYKGHVTSEAQAWKEVPGIGKDIAKRLFEHTPSPAASTNIVHPKDNQEERRRLGKELQSAIHESRILDNGDPYEWQVVMLADYREQLPAIQKKCESEGVPFRKMPLAVGDYIFAATKKIPFGAGNEKDAEYIVLGPIVERKTPADLHGRKKGKRWKRQKESMNTAKVRDLVLLMEGHCDAGNKKDTFWKVTEKEISNDFKNPFWRVVKTNGPDNTGQVLVHLYWEAVEKFRRHQFDSAYWYSGRKLPLTLREVKAQHALGKLPLRVQSDIPVRLDSAAATNVDLDSGSDDDSVEGGSKTPITFDSDSDDEDSLEHWLANRAARPADERVSLLRELTSRKGLAAPIERNMLEPASAGSTKEDPIVCD